MAMEDIRGRHAASAAEPDLLWINSITSRVPNDKITRTKIRKQAMKKVVAERKSASVLDSNLVLVSTTGLRNVQDIYQNFTASGKQSQQIARILNTAQQLTNNIAGGLTSYSAYEVPNKIPVCISMESSSFFEVQYCFNPYDPTCISRISPGRPLISSHDLVRLLGRRHHTHYSYFQERYGRSPCLTNATKCIVARIDSLISPKDVILERFTIYSYNKALQSMQEALEECQHPAISDLLCATELLALYELLSPTTSNIWTRHVAGAGGIMRLFRPRLFRTEFEKSILMSQAGLIVTQSILNNEACFLEQPGWQKTLRSMIIMGTTISERSETIVSLVIRMAFIPRIFRDVTESVYREERISEAVLEDLKSRAHHLRRSLHKWQTDHFDSKMYPLPGTMSADGYCKILVLFYSCVIQSNRLLAAVSWENSALVAEIESETQRFSQSVMELVEKRDKPYTSLQGALLVAQKIRIAKATILTFDDWQPMLLEINGFGAQGSRMISRLKFKRWCQLLGRNNCL